MCRGTLTAHDTEEGERRCRLSLLLLLDLQKPYFRLPATVAVADLLRLRANIAVNILSLGSAGSLSFSSRLQKTEAPEGHYCACGVWAKSSVLGRSHLAAASCVQRPGNDIRQFHSRWNFSKILQQWRR